MPATEQMSSALDFSCGLAQGILFPALRQCLDISGYYFMDTPDFCISP